MRAHASPQDIEIIIIAVTCPLQHKENSLACAAALSSALTRAFRSLSEQNQHGSDTDRSMKEPPRNKSRANADLFPVTFVKSYPAIDTKWRQGAARGNARSIIALARSPYKGPFIPPSGEGGGGGGRRTVGE